MSKGLKALEIIKNAPTIYVGCASDIYTRHPFECKQIEKELKALEIIKNIGVLKPYETSGGQCWLETMSDATKITKEEFELLKEVLI